MEEGGLAVRSASQRDVLGGPFSEMVKHLLATESVPPCSFAVAAIDGCDAALACGHRGWVTMVYTLPTFRRRGAGRAALLHLIAGWESVACVSCTPEGERLVAQAGIDDRAQDRCEPEYEVMLR